MDFISEPTKLKTQWMWCEYHHNRIAMQVACYNNRREKGDKVCPYRKRCAKGGGTNAKPKEGAVTR